MRLTLICHGATAATGAAAFPCGEGLTAAGLRRATAAAGAIGPCDGAWTSPAPAAGQTAAALGLAARAEPMLRDADWGRWAGRRLADIGAEAPEAVAAWLADPAAAPHGGESVLDLLARVARWLAARADDAGHVVAISHPALVRAAVVTVLDAAPRSFWRIDAAPLTWTDLRRSEGRWTLRGTGLPL